MQGWRGLQKGQWLPVGPGFSQDTQSYMGDWMQRDGCADPDQMTEEDVRKDPGGRITER